MAVLAAKLLFPEGVEGLAAPARTHRRPENGQF
jgi:hypothetical protein